MTSYTTAHAISALHNREPTITVRLKPNLTKKERNIIMRAFNRGCLPIYHDRITRMVIPYNDIGHCMEIAYQKLRIWHKMCSS